MGYTGSWSRIVAVSCLLVAAVSPRAGAATQGPNSPGTVVNDNSVGIAAWTLPGNALASDDVYAQATPAGSPTQYLKATGFGLAVPAGAIVDGITVAIERRSAAGLVSDSAVRIVKGGVIGTANRAAGGAWPTTDTIVTYGGASDLWGETWTPSDLNSGGFGVVLSATDSVDVAAVDHVAVTVHYSLCGDNQTDASEQCDDGNTVGGDCCSATCQYESPGSPCMSDGDVCTADECDGAGACAHSAVCTDQPVSAVKLVMKRAPSGKEKVVFVSKDPAFLFPAPNGANDPRSVGAMMEVLSENEGMASFAMPDTEWKLNTPATVFKFVNKLAPSGPSLVKVAVLKQGKVLKVVSREAGLPLAGAHDRVAVRVQTGLVRNCALFENGTILRDEANRFIAKRALAPSILDCSAASLGFGSPSGAFLEGPC